MGRDPSAAVYPSQSAGATNRPDDMHAQCEQLLEDFKVLKRSLETRKRFANFKRILLFDLWEPLLIEHVLGVLSSAENILRQLDHIERERVRCESYLDILRKLDLACGPKIDQLQASLKSDTPDQWLKKNIKFLATQGAQLFANGSLNSPTALFQFAKVSDRASLNSLLRRYIQGQLYPQEDVIKQNATQNRGNAAAVVRCQCTSDLCPPELRQATVLVLPVSMAEVLENLHKIYSRSRTPQEFITETVPESLLCLIVSGKLSGELAAKVWRRLTDIYRVYKSQKQHPQLCSFFWDLLCESWNYCDQILDLRIYPKPIRDKPGWFEYPEQRPREVTILPVCGSIPAGVIFEIDSFWCSQLPQCSGDKKITWKRSVGNCPEDILEVFRLGKFPCSTNSPDLSPFKQWQSEVKSLLFREKVDGRPREEVFREYCKKLLDQLKKPDSEALKGLNYIVQNAYLATNCRAMTDNDRNIWREWYRVLKETVLKEERLYPSIKEQDANHIQLEHPSGLAWDELSPDIEFEFSEKDPKGTVPASKHAEVQFSLDPRNARYTVSLGTERKPQAAKELWKAAARLNRSIQNNPDPSCRKWVDDFEKRCGKEFRYEAHISLGGRPAEDFGSIDFASDLRGFIRYFGRPELKEAFSCLLRYAEVKGWTIRPSCYEWGMKYGDLDKKLREEDKKYCEFTFEFDPDKPCGELTPVDIVRNTEGSSISEQWHFRFKVSAGPPPELFSEVKDALEKHGFHKGLEILTEKLPRKIVKGEDSRERIVAHEIMDIYREVADKVVATFKEDASREAYHQLLGVVKSMGEKANLGFFEPRSVEEARQQSEFVQILEQEPGANDVKVIVLGVEFEGRKEITAKVILRRQD
jgi:hypothetical protein